MPEALLNKVKQGKGTVVDLGSRYTTLSTIRNQYLDRGREYSRFTLPYILPENDQTNRGADANQHGYQGIGAQSVNHLANKLTTTMFPVQRSFFKLEFEEKVKSQLEEAGYDATRLSELLVTGEKRVENYQTKIASRVAYVDAFKGLLISGNIMLYMPQDDSALQAIKLNRYCVKRDTSGKFMEAVIEDRKAFSGLAQETQDALKALKGPGVCKKDEEVKLYTWIYRIDADTFGVAQSALGVLIKDLQEIPEAELPWIPLRWNSTQGEDYGRGLVEDHAGDFYVIEFLSEALVKGMALMADIKYLIKPGSVTDIDEIATAPTGEWVFGQLEDIGVLQLEKYADFKPIAEVLAEYKKRIGQAFLMNSAVRRDAERVTTVELRIDAQELETSLGGVYSLLAQTMQTPLAYIYLKRVGFPLPEESVIPSIVTGLAALGRIGELDKLKQYTEMMQLPQTWPVQVQERVKWDVYSREVAAGLSMKLPFMMNDDEWKAHQQAQAKAREQEQIAEAGKAAAPELVKQVGPEIINQGGIK